MLWVYRRGLSRDTVGSIATTLLVVPAVSSRCLWLNQTQYGGAKRDCTGGHSIHRVPLRFKRVCKWKEAQRIIIIVSGGGGRRRKPSGLKVLICGLDAGTPLAAAASRFAPTTPTCFLSIKPTATASVASPRRLREGPLSRDFRPAQWALRPEREVQF